MAFDDDLVGFLGVLWILFLVFSLFFMGDLGALWDSLGFRGVRLLDPCGVFWIQEFGGFVYLGFEFLRRIWCRL